MSPIHTLLQSVAGIRVQPTEGTHEPTRVAIVRFRPKSRLAAGGYMAKRDFPSVFVFFRAGLGALDEVAPDAPDDLRAGHEPLRPKGALSSPWSASRQPVGRELVRKL